MAVVKLRLAPAEVLSPAGTWTADLGPIPDPLDSLEGKTIAFWHDSTPEADVIYPVVKRHLEGLGVAEVLLARQPGPASAPLAENLDLVRRANACVAGVAW